MGGDTIAGCPHFADTGAAVASSKSSEGRGNRVEEGEPARPAHGATIVFKLEAV